MKSYTRILTLIILSLLISTTEILVAQSTLFSKSINSKKQALIVGVSDYAGDRSDLSGIERDTDKMRQLFERWGFEVKILYDSDSMQIIDYLNQYGESLGSEDFFAFYYSGHGSHTEDTSGDEADGQDETLVLSDGVENKHLIDDILYTKFNAIKAKKLIFFDSCHSGTVFRSINGKTQSKTISPDAVTQSFTPSRGIKIGKEDAVMDRSSSYIVFSSSQDDEESLATTSGSLFTNALYDLFSDSSSQNRSFNEINTILTKKVVDYATKTAGKPHHPNISFSNSFLGSDSLKNFIDKKQTTTMSTNRDQSLEETLNNLMISNRSRIIPIKYKRTSYRSGDSVQFEIDTKGEKGYLTIFYIDQNDVTLLYPNPFIDMKQIKGRYLFPNDLSNGKFDLEAYKSCSGCQEERTVIYTLLSKEPISDTNLIKSRGGLLSFAKGSNESKVMSRSIMATPNTDKGFKPLLGKYEFIVR